jgi:hypothetical protein
MAFLSKPTLLFLSFNALRLLSVVGLCLVFASEIVTINSCVSPLLSQLYGRESLRRLTLRSRAGAVETGT